MRVYGLIGFPLGHSFSQRYFSEKFEREGIRNTEYRLFELPLLQHFPRLWKEMPALRGVNVTIPYKQAVIPYLHRLDASAEAVGAVNVIRREADGSLTGFNTDYLGFLKSLKAWLPAEALFKALVLGTGGSSRAVQAALQTLQLPYRRVSRQPGKDELSYEELNKEIVEDYRLIINCTPLSATHYLYDLVYNPEKTAFLAEGEKKGARIKNGLEMLYTQAEAAWQIWQQL
jgi:shikimate dehydrogenase